MTIEYVLVAARSALASHPGKGTGPVISVVVRRDVREFGPKRERTINPGLRSRIETYRNEQTRFAFAPTSVDETVEVAVINEKHGQFRLELASEQHLWATHRDWTHDPVPTVIADSDEDGGELTGRGVYSVQGVAR